MAVFGADLFRPAPRVGHEVAERAGLTKADQGRVLADDQPVEGPGRHRLVMFQEAALFPWLTVRRNVEAQRSAAAAFSPASNNRDAVLAARMFSGNHLVEARVHNDGHGLFVKTRDPDKFYLLLNEVVAEGEVDIESVAPVDDDLSAVYEYLIGSQ